MSGLSDSEARLVSLQVRVTELQLGDQVGPSDVLQPIAYTVVGVPERTFEQRRDPVALGVLLASGEESLLTAAAATRVYVRRMIAVMTRIHGDDNVTDRVLQTVMLRPILFGAWTLTDLGVTRLRARDRLSFTAG